MSDVFPPNVFSNIFSRLPVKSLLRSRCVSKPVCALIDSPHFIKSHLHQSLISNTNRTIITASIDCSRIYYIDFDLYNRAATLIHHPFEHSGAHFLASCNGLFLLLTAKSIDTCVIETVVQPDPPNLNLVLVNPTTRNHKLLPVSPIEYPPYYLKTACELVNYGFGYDSVNDDYKVLRIAQFPNLVKNEVKIFSLKLNAWKRVQDFPYRLSCTSHAVFVNGALHWLVFSPDSKMVVMIVSFDLGTEQYGLLSGPPIYKLENMGLLRELGGKLSLQLNYDMKFFHVWVMEDYGVRGSWTKLLSVVQNVDFQFLNLRAMAYSGDGKKVLLVQDAGQLIWYDLELQVIYKITNPVIPEFWKAYVSGESLVKLSCGASTTDLAQVQKKANKRDDFLSKGFKLVL